VNVSGGPGKPVYMRLNMDAVLDGVSQRGPTIPVWTIEMEPWEAEMLRFAYKNISSKK